MVDGQPVMGILCAPANTAPARALIFTHGWSGNRHGPAGILVDMARRFAAQGVVSLRFDFRGRGESGGEGLQSTLTTMADDLVAASDFLLKETALKKITYFGMCSGGNVAIGTLKRLPMAENIIMLSVYPFSDGDAFGRDLHRTAHFLKVYWMKACRPETWKRLFGGDVHLGQVFNVLFGHLLKRGANKKKEGTAATTAPAAPPQHPESHKPQVAKPTQTESRLGGEAPKAHLANLRPDLQGLMIYGLGDPDAVAAMDYFGSYVKENRLPIRFETIPGANHNFSSSQWRNHVADLCLGALAEWSAKA